MVFRQARHIRRARVDSETAGRMCLPHEKCGEVRTDTPQVRQRADHPHKPACLLENGIKHRLHLFNQLQNEIKTIEQTFDTRLSGFLLNKILNGGLAFPPSEKDADKRENSGEPL
jgi:hypothetical protein